MANLSCRGISDEALELSDLHCSIPMKGMVDSFNVSVAAGILMHHAVCDRTSRLVMTIACSTLKKFKLLSSFGKWFMTAIFLLLLSFFLISLYSFLFNLKEPKGWCLGYWSFVKLPNWKLKCPTQLFDLVKSCHKFVASKGEAKFSFLPVLNGFMFTYYQSLLELLHCMSF